MVVMGGHLTGVNRIPSPHSAIQSMPKTAGKY